MYSLKITDEFDAAHFLINTNTACDNLHGHRWKVWVTLESENLSPLGWVVNFSTVKKWLKEVIEEYDHNVLNYYLDQPTAENLCYVIFRHLHMKLVAYNKEIVAQECITCGFPFEAESCVDRKFCSQKCAQIDFGKKKEKIVLSDPIQMNVQLKKVEIAETPGNIASYSCADIDVKKESHRRGSKKRSKLLADSIKGPKIRKKISEGVKKAWADPVKRNKRIGSMVEAFKDPELRKQRSERMIQNNPMRDRKNVEKMIQALRKSQKLSPNKEEQKVIEFFKENCLPLLFVGDGSYIIDGKLPDFISKSKRIVVEYNSRFWHSDNNLWYDTRDDSGERKKFFEDRGYKFYIIWDDIFENDKVSILRDLKNLFAD